MMKNNVVLFPRQFSRAVLKKPAPIYEAPNDRPNWQLISLYTKSQIESMGLIVPPRGMRSFSLKREVHESDELVHHIEYELCVHLTDQKGVYGDRLYAYWYRLVDYSEHRKGIVHVE